MGQCLEKILVIRRDNIGDLICTTPLLTQLRKSYPTAQIDVLVNSYNVAAIAFNPDINNVYVYTKGKHRLTNQSLWQIYWPRFKLIWRLKKNHYSAIILAGGYSQHAVHLAKQIKAPIVIGFVSECGKNTLLTHSIHEPKNSLHEAERTLLLASALGINASPPLPKLTLKVDTNLVKHYSTAINNTSLFSNKSKKIIALHISARKKDQRWPAEYFVELIQQLNQSNLYNFILFWSPGDENNKHHPGDDQKAQAIIQALPNTPLLPCSTHQLEELIAAMSLCDRVICSDGGAMHVAAGLGKPIVCFFGSSNAKQWHPWGVPHVVLQPDSQQVADIKPYQVVEALASLG